MSIEAIKEALAAYSNAVDAVIATQEGDDPHAAALAVQGVDRAQEVWKTWTQPEYIAPMIERMEAAEKDAARAKQCALKYLDYLGNSDPEKGLALDMRDPEMVGVELAAVDFGSGALAEGVSDA